MRTQSYASHQRSLDRSQPVLPSRRPGHCLRLARPVILLSCTVLRAKSFRSSFRAGPATTFLASRDDLGRLRPIGSESPRTPAQPYFDRKGRWIIFNKAIRQPLISSHDFIRHQPARPGATAKNGDLARCLTGHVREPSEGKIQ
jgi:hypothetical protein